jgi:hypothetical protein
VNTRATRLSRFSALAAATMITAVSAWAFVNSTASSERDPFQFASIMATNAKARVAQTVESQGMWAEVQVYTPPDLLAAPPACLGSCA